MITINKPGLLDTIQDLGRYGFQKYGVVTSGAMDSWAHRIANLIVGNQDDECTLEMTLVGPHIKFEEDALIALCGGDLQPKIDGVSVPMWKPIYVKRNAVLKMGGALKGCRTYLAVAGSFKITSKMNSKSTYLKAEIGGFKGRKLQEGDILQFNEKSVLSERIFKKLKPTNPTVTFQTTDWSVTQDLIPKLAFQYEIRVTPGRQFDLFDENSKKKIFTEPFTVSSQSDRMGYRLTGPALALSHPEELISDAVSYGSVQVPPDGNPIILVADRQTTGGYPKISQIATVDQSFIAQSKPGERLSFKKITVEQSQELYVEREKMLKSLLTGVLLKFN